MLHLAPERFFVRGKDERGRFKQKRPSFIVVYEAHYVDQWGRDFRREYGRDPTVRCRFRDANTCQSAVGSFSDFVHGVAASQGKLIGGFVDQGFGN
ncbi:hypothetical protein [Mesorhizobium captivum]|uniref:hypothetical protein n=1 Tax=Mesorhizobium captivum TaxID=3072319 RepID=UPI002A240E73|nr:hypothetical protein [Mesorhizobium sp. VK3C]MDX8449251.1 hypothetical protein [Mesorhizobium sp. VK3C]